MRRIGIALLGLVLIAGAVTFVFRTEIRQLYRVAHLFDETEIVGNFQNMNELFPTRNVSATGDPSRFSRAEGTLPTSFMHDGRRFDTEAFLEDTVTTGLLVIRDGTIRYEDYARQHTENGRHIGWSVSKSLVSALFGIALEEGVIGDLMDPVTKYLPELEGSGYDGVPIKFVLQMSSGVGFNEDYGDPNSDINRMGRAMAMGGSLLEFAGSLERVRPPGTLQHYVSMDTQVLGEILIRTTGQSLAAYTEEKIWGPVGMESDAYWVMDGRGIEMAFGGFNASLRDFGRLGQLYLNGGRAKGRQIVPADWVLASVTPDAPHLEPGPKPGTDNRMGYGYQWWIPEGANGQFLALGVYNQLVYVDPESQVVIAKNSANRNFQAMNFESTRETVSFFRAIIAGLASVHADLDETRDPVFAGQSAAASIRGESIRFEEEWAHADRF